MKSAIYFSLSMKIFHCTLIKLKSEYYKGFNITFPAEFFLHINVLLWNFSHLSVAFYCGVTLRQNDPFLSKLIRPRFKEILPSKSHQNKQCYHSSGNPSSSCPETGWVWREMLFYDCCMYIFLHKHLLLDITRENKTKLKLVDSLVFQFEQEGGFKWPNGSNP